MVAVLRGKGLDVTVEPERCPAVSRDHSWLPPILSSRLPAERAAAVAYPFNAEQVATAVATVFCHEVPVILRGRARYGQAVPLRGSLFIDTGRLDRIFEFTDEWALDP